MLRFVFQFFVSVALVSVFSTRTLVSAKSVSAMSEWPAPKESEQAYTRAAAPFEAPTFELPGKALLMEFKTKLYPD